MATANDIERLVEDAVVDRLEDYTGAGKPLAGWQIDRHGQNDEANDRRRITVTVADITEVVRGTSIYAGNCEIIIEANAMIENGPDPAAAIGGVRDIILSNGIEVDLSARVTGVFIFPRSVSEVNASQVAVEAQSRMRLFSFTFRACAVV